MVYWQFLFLSNQRFALLALFLDLLHQTGVTLQLRLPYGERFLNMRFATANMRELITEDQHPAAQLLQPLRNGRYGAGDQCGQLFDFSFQLPQQRIVCPDLPVDLAAVSDDAFPLQRTCGYALMNGGLLVQSSGGVAAVVDALRPSGTFQIEIGHIRPRLAPFYELFLAVPAFGDGILSAIASAFGMLVCSDKFLRLGSRWRHIHLLFADLVGILFLPALVLRRLEFGGGEAAFLTVSHAEIFLLGLVLPVPLLIQRAHRQQNVGVGIVAVGVMDGSIGAHSIGHKLLPDKRLQQLDLLLPAQLNGQGHDELTGKSAVLGRLNFLHGVPELFTISPFLWGIFRQKHLLPDKPLFSCVVMLNPVVIVIQTGTAQISGSSHGGASCASADHLRFQMINRHILFTSFFLFLLLFRKRENDPKSSFGS